MAISISLLPEILRPKELEIEQKKDAQWALNYAKEAYKKHQGYSMKCYVSAIDFLDTREITIIN
jgi:cytochrome b subunit of formate dehydrogenase